MAIMRIGPVAIISGVALAGVAAATTLFMRDDEPSAKTDAAVESAAPATAAHQEEPVIVADAAEVPGGAEATAVTAAPASIDFSLGSLDDLRDGQLASIVDKIEKVEGVASDTKIWVATADVARAPGAERFYHIKGPLTCGRIGCDLIVVSEAKAILLDTIGEGVSSPAFDTLVINQGTGSAVTWVFDGSAFAEKR